MFDNNHCVSSFHLCIIMSSGYDDLFVRKDIFVIGRLLLDYMCSKDHEIVKDRIVVKEIEL